MKDEAYIVPEGESGNWAVSYFDVSEEAASLENLRASIGSSSRPIKAGRYMRLMRGGTLVMSDTPAELSDFRHILYRCKGHVLINGLGLGIVADAVLSREGVDHVTVIEVSSDVIALTGPTLEARYGDKLTIVNADALAWKSPRGIRYNVVWHDIWDTICGDNKETMSKLHRKYGRRCDWQDSWCRDSVMNR